MTVPEAVEISKRHLIELLPELMNTEIKLEELDVSPYSNKWKFTFSAMTFPPSGSTFEKILRGTRISKSVEIDPSNGDLLSMRNAAA